MKDLKQLENSIKSDINRLLMLIISFGLGMLLMYLLNLNL